MVSSQHYMLKQTVTVKDRLPFDCTGCRQCHVTQQDKWTCIGGHRLEDINKVIKELTHGSNGPGMIQHETLQNITVIKTRSSTVAERDRAMLHVIEDLAKSLKVTQGHSK